jgi:hypothetical protein
MKKQVLTLKFVTPKAHCSDIEVVVQELVTSTPKGKYFSLVALESIAGMLCSSILHGALVHGLRATAARACCASQAHYASGFCHSMYSVVVSSMLCDSICSFHRADYLSYWFVAMMAILLLGFN